MDRIIKLPDDWEKRIGEMLDFQIVDFLCGIIRNGMPIPNNATNGNVITAMFPNAKIVETDLEVFLYTGAKEKDEDIQIFDTEWWNAPYQKGGKE